MYRSLIICSLAAAAANAAAVPASSLTGWAEIPHTFRQPGLVSGQFQNPANGVVPPYEGLPIPGFSGMLAAPTPGNFYGLPDNGYGAQGNSADFVIGFYEVTPSFKTTGDGTTSRGPVSIQSFTPFRDPLGLLSSAFVNGGPVYSRTTYYSTSAIPVDPVITTNKLLTGADFDVESFARMDDGSFWVGEEFGPYLLHFSAAGELLRTPVPHPTLRAPQNPANTVTEPPNLPSSRGFESMTRNADGSRLYLTTEASIASEPDKRMLEIFEFDTQTGQYTGTVFKYAKDSSDQITGGVDNATNIFVTGDMAFVANDKFVMIERDDFQGPPSSVNPPRQKKIYLFDLSEADADGVLKKTLLVDLLDIADPLDIGGPLAEIPEDSFNFPLQSVESVYLIDEFTLLVGLDNNYPGGNGRVPGTPDGTEMITIRFDSPIAATPVPVPPALLLMAGGLAALLRRRC